MKTESVEDELGGLACAWRFDFSRSTRESPYLSNEDTGMYPSSPSIRQTAQTLSLNSQYIPPPYDFTSYHHHLTGVGDFAATTWNPLYAPRDEYPYSFQGSSPSAAQVSFPCPELSSAPSAAGGGSLTPYNFFSGQDPLSPRKRSHEPVKQTTSGGNLLNLYAQNNRRLRGHNAIFTKSSAEWFVAS